MAVRHGYGKIAGTDALVFAYDTGDTRNSYKGEPTVNNISGGANVADCISGPLNYGAQGGVAVIATLEYYSEKRPHIFRIKSTNDTGYNMINQQSSILNQSGTTYTYSYDFKQLRGSTQQDSSCTVYGNGYKNPDSSGYSSNVSIVNTPLEDGWTRRAITYTATYTGYNYYRFNLWTGGARADGAGDFEFLFDNFQIETNSHGTPFTNNTRSATQGLLDLTGNNTISLNSSTFDSNAQIDLDGTNTSIYPGTISAASGLSEVTFETVVRSNANNKNILLTAGNAILLHYGGAGFYLVSSDGTASGYLGWNSEIAGGTGVYEHLAATWDGSTMKLYVNGQKITYDRSFSGGTSGVLKPFNNTTLGGYFNSTQPNFNGNIDVAKIYNRALTADEVRNNYRHYKTRFDI